MNAGQVAYVGGTRGRTIIVINRVFPPVSSRASLRDVSASPPDVCAVSLSEPVMSITKPVCENTFNIFLRSFVSFLFQKQKKSKHERRSRHFLLIICSRFICAVDSYLLHLSRVCVIFDIIHRALRHP